MEATFIDEREVTCKLVSNLKSRNASLLSLIRERSIALDINPDRYIGGLSCAISSEDLSLESNINNLIAVYNNNFIESILYQLDNIKKDQTLTVVLSYLKSRGLEDDFIKFKQQQGGQNTNNVIMLN